MSSDKFDKLAAALRKLRKVARGDHAYANGRRMDENEGSLDWVHWDARANVCSNYESLINSLIAEHRIDD